MKEILLSLAAGLIIGAFFKYIKLPVPVPHGLGGIVGILGMFIGSEIVAHVTKVMAAK